MKHPTDHIDPALTQKIRDFSRAAELLKQLHPEQIAIIQEKKWFRLFVPAYYGGLALSLPAALHLEEAIAWVDGAVGWTVTLCAGAGWFVGFLDSAVAATIFSNPLACLAGSGKSAAIAKKIAGGYEISGHWSHASGAAHATIFTGNCQLEENGQPLYEEDGSKMIRPFVFLQNEVQLQQNWNSLGMKATGSVGFEINNLVVPLNRLFQINHFKANLADPIFQYPFKSFAEATLAVNSSGMAIHFFDLCAPLFEEAKNESLMPMLQTAQDQLNDCRQQFYQSIENSWNLCQEEKEFSPALIAEISQTSKNLAFTARQLVDGLYPYCGMIAANPDTDINRVWRDLHTASQHSLFIRTQ
jgi:alkylation response protein AidB-like acyl-CoA dehydrogenase